MPRLNSVEEANPPTDLISGYMPVADIYPLGGGAELLDEYSSIPIIIEKRSLVPWQNGVAAHQKGDNGQMRNRLDDDMENYDYRMYALTLVHNGPEYTGIVQHTMQENAQDFSVANGQTKPLTVDQSRYLPYPSDDSDVMSM